MSKQEQMYNRINQRFVKIVEAQPGLPHKQDVLAFFRDMIESPGYRDNMILSIANELELLEKEQDKKTAGELENIIKMLPNVADADNENTQKVAVLINQMIEELLQAEEPAQTVDQIMESEGITDEDLKEVGGGDEDDTPLI